MKLSGNSVLCRSIQVVLKMLLVVDECRVEQCSRQLLLVETICPDVLPH